MHGEYLGAEDSIDLITRNLIHPYKVSSSYLTNLYVGSAHKHGKKDRSRYLYIFLEIEMMRDLFIWAFVYYVGSRVPPQPVIKSVGVPKINSKDEFRDKGEDSSI
jgi:hypothetical protein